jgi:hypothetical protein
MEAGGERQEGVTVQRDGFQDKMGLRDRAEWSMEELRVVGMS